MSMPGDLKRGGRTALHKLILNEQQYNWVTSQLSKREQLGKATGVNKKNPKLFKLLLDLNDYVFGAEFTNLGFVVSTPRSHLRLLADIVKTQVDTLVKCVLPAYEAKSDLGEAYAVRQKEAKELTKQLKALSDQAERIYEAGNKRRNSQYGKR